MKNRLKIRASVFLSRKHYGVVLAGSILFAAAMFFQNCAPVEFSEQSLASQGADGVCIGNECDNVTPPICLFNGEVVKEGASINAFLNSTVPYGAECVSEARVCRNGSLSGSYSYAHCAIGAAASCLFNSQTIAHGQAVKAYQNSSVGSDARCVEETRICTNGVLSGSYRYANCTVAAPSSCLFNGQTIPHGGSVVAFQKSSIAFGQTCQSETRFCQNGTLTGSNPYASCAIESARSCLFDGRTIAHGESVIAYMNSIEPYGQSCKQQSRYCQDGSLSGSYNKSSCIVQKAVCIPLAVSFSRTGIGLEGNHCKREVMYERTFTNPYNANAIFDIDVRSVDDTYLIDNQEIKPNHFLRFMGADYQCNAPHADKFSKVVGPGQTVKLSVADNHGTAVSIDATVCFQGL